MGQSTNGSISVPFIKYISAGKVSKDEFCYTVFVSGHFEPLLLLTDIFAIGIPPYLACPESYLWVPASHRRREKRTENRHRKCARVDDSMAPAGPAHQVEKTGITLKPFSTTLALSNNAAHKFVPPKCWNISIRRFASQSDLFIRHFRSTVRNWLKKILKQFGC